MMIFFHKNHDVLFMLQDSSGTQVKVQHFKNPNIYKSYILIFVAPAIDSNMIGGGVVILMMMMMFYSFFFGEH